jgi:hypothetical protein
MAPKTISKDLIDNLAYYLVTREHNTATAARGFDDHNVPTWDKASDDYKNAARKHAEQILRGDGA